ncbi:MAG: 3'-5' exonuclease domain-containing protein 2 [Paramuribaculum sp.]|nr:3'-5' exonuclease domain-containing protein 2 [Paramuribaculum sp.]
MNHDDLRISIDKATIASLPTVIYQGNPIIINTVEQATEALNTLRKESLVGFDTETRPTFNKGQRHNVALVQISTADDCYLFRINKIGFLTQLIDFITSADTTKIGLSLKDDFMMLRRMSDFTPESFIDLQTYVRQFGIIDTSLQKIYAIIFGQRISKGQRLTNWEAEPLTTAQQHYAAIDAWACRQIYTHLSQGLFHPEESPYILPPEPTETISQ